MAILYLAMAFLAALDMSLIGLQMLPWFNGMVWLRVHFITSSHLRRNALSGGHSLPLAPAEISLGDLAVIESRYIDVIVRYPPGEWVAHLLRGHVDFRGHYPANETTGADATARSTTEGSRTKSFRAKIIHRRG